MPEFTNEKLMLCSHDMGWARCAACQRHLRCHKLTASLRLMQVCAMSLCPACLTAVARALHNSRIARVLQLVLDDALRMERRLVLYQENEKRKEREAKWEEAVAMLCRSLENRQGAEANKVSVIKVVMILAGLDIGESTALVHKAAAAALKPLELPAPQPVPASPELNTGPSFGPPTKPELHRETWLRWAREVCRMLEHKPGPLPCKIELIKLFREITGMGLKEAKDLIEEALAKEGSRPAG